MKTNFISVVIFLIISLSLIEENYTQIISHDNKFYISLNEEQNNFLSEFFNEENLKKLEQKKINEGTFLINDPNLKMNLASNCDDIKMDSIKTFVKSCKFN